MAKKTVAAKKRNVKLTLMDSCMFIHLLTTLLFLLQTAKVRSFLGLLLVKMGFRGSKKNTPTQHRWLPRIVLR